jgi:hypothetical protein
MTFRASWIAQSRSDEIAIMEDPPSSYHRIPELLLYSIAPLAMLVTAPLLARGLGPVARGQYGVAIAIGTFALTLVC